MIPHFTKSFSVAMVSALSLFSVPTAWANLSALSYFDMGAKAYYGSDLEAAKEAVNLGLDRYPDNVELTALRDLIERAQQRQQQQQDQQDQEQQENQEQQESESEGDQDGDQGEQGEDGQQGDQGQQQDNQGQQGQDSQNEGQGQEGNTSDQSNNSNQQNNSQDGEESQENGQPDGENQSGKSAEEYADQSLGDGSEDSLGELLEQMENDPTQAAEMGGEGRTVYMTEEEAMRLLETLSGQEKQLPFITIERSDADKLNREKKDY